MTKADLIDEVSKLAELTRKDGEVIVETIFDSIVKSLRAGDKIEIRGFGSFRTRQRKPRTGRNPKTGAKASGRCRMTCRDQPTRYCLRALPRPTTVCGWPRQDPGASAAQGCCAR